MNVCIHMSCDGRRGKEGRACWTYCRLSAKAAPVHHRHRLVKGGGGKNNERAFVGEGIVAAGVSLCHHLAAITVVTLP